MKNIDPKRAKWIRLRMGLLSAMLALGLGVVVSAAYGIQVQNGDEWRQLAEKQRQRRLHVVPKRGAICDRHGFRLAESADVPSVSVDAFAMLRGIPHRSQDAFIDQAAARVAKALALDPIKVRRKLARRRRFAWLRRGLTAEQVHAIRALRRGEDGPKLRGLSIEGEGRRYFPNRDLAAPILGFVSPGGVGKDGIELTMNEQLRGRVGDIRGLRDRAGRLIFSEDMKDSSLLAGNNVYLSIDQAIQFAAERELASAIKTHEAKSGSVIVVAPATGEILAMASFPTYNPNDVSKSLVESRRNRAITEQFEPGSTMKVFTMSAALATHTIKPTQTIYCEEGVMALDNVNIRDTHVSGWLSPTQILAISSNIGAAKLGLSLGERRLYKTFQRFGFGTKTELPLPGEARGVLRPRGRPWVQVETAAASFGQGISVTTIQLAMGIAAIANGGKLLRPILVKRVTDATGKVLKQTPVKVVREAVPRRVARTVAEMLVAVTEGHGTGVEAAVPGFKTAGKTATAQKTDPATGKYSKDLYTASFIGFVPADRPRLAIAVVVDEPMIGHAGGSVAAPVFRRVAQVGLRTLGLTPHGAPAESLKDIGKEPDMTAEATAATTPSQPTAAPAPTIAPQLPTSHPAASGAKPVQDVKGMPAAQALRVLMKNGFVPTFNGSGVVFSQDPPPGTMAPEGTPIHLQLHPTP